MVGPPSTLHQTTFGRSLWKTFLGLLRPSSSEITGPSMKTTVEGVRTSGELLPPGYTKAGGAGVRSRPRPVGTLPRRDGPGEGPSHPTCASGRPGRDTWWLRTSTQSQYLRRGWVLEGRLQEPLPPPVSRRGPGASSGRAVSDGVGGEMPPMSRGTATASGGRSASVASPRPSPASPPATAARVGCRSSRGRRRRGASSRCPSGTPTSHSRDGGGGDGGPCGTGLGT